MQLHKETVKQHTEILKEAADALFYGYHISIHDKIRYAEALKFFNDVLEEIEK